MRNFALALGVFCIAAIVMTGCVKKSDYSKMQIGTVRYIPIEGGFYGIYGEHGQRLDPANLPVKFQKDSLKIRFTAVEHKDMLGIHMWGKLIEVKDVELLEK
jgi:hypothetical protein